MKLQRRLCEAEAFVEASKVQANQQMEYMERVIEDHQQRMSQVRRAEESASETLQSELHNAKREYRQEVEHAERSADEYEEMLKLADNQRDFAVAHHKQKFKALQETTVATIKKFAETEAQSSAPTSGRVSSCREPRGVEPRGADAGHGWDAGQHGGL